MKLIIGFALLSVAFALPAIQPVLLPEAELPAYETYDAVPVFQQPDISPLLIPIEVVEALRMIGESPFDMPEDTVQIVEVAENFVEDDVDDSVIVVDHVQEEIPYDGVSDDEVTPVKFIDVPEDVVDPVKFVEVAENVADDSVLVETVPIENVMRTAFEPVEEVDFDNFARNEDIPENVDAVILVDHAEEPADEEAVNTGSVIVVDEYQTPSEDTVDPVMIVNEAINNSEQNVNEEINEVDPVRVVNEAVPSDVDEIVSQVLTADINENEDRVKVVNSPLENFPPKYYDNPLLR